MGGFYSGYNVGKGEKSSLFNTFWGFRASVLASLRSSPYSSKALFSALSELKKHTKIFR